MDVWKYYLSFLLCQVCDENWQFCDCFRLVGHDLLCMLVQILYGHPEAGMDFVERDKEECLHKPDEVVESRTLLLQLSQLLWGDVGVECSIPMELTPRDLGSRYDGWYGAPDSSLKVDRDHCWVSLVWKEKKFCYLCYIVFSKCISHSKIINKPTFEHCVGEFGHLAKELQICRRTLVWKQGVDHRIRRPLLHDGVQHGELAPGRRAHGKRSIYGNNWGLCEEVDAKLAREDSDELLSVVLDRSEIP